MSIWHHRESGYKSVYWQIDRWCSGNTRDWWASRLAHKSSNCVYSAYRLRFHLSNLLSNFSSKNFGQGWHTLESSDWRVCKHFSVKSFHRTLFSKQFCRFSNYSVYRVSVQQRYETFYTWQTSLFAQTCLLPLVSVRGNLKNFKNRRLNFKFPSIMFLKNAVCATVSSFMIQCSNGLLLWYVFILPETGQTTLSLKPEKSKKFREIVFVWQKWSSNLNNAKIQSENLFLPKKKYLWVKTTAASSLDAICNGDADDI